uniref:RIKEN cDNA 4931429L15 gene n=1 Tax=Peromyscus maniculatus bairdii TaxID=230844 RepID=A0A8C8TLI8_PERMB
MQLNLLSQDTWRHGHHGAYLGPIERESPLTLRGSPVSHLYYILSPGDRRAYPLDDSSNSIQRQPLAVPMGLEDSAPGVQQQQQQQQPGIALQELEKEEIAPTDVKYRLQLLEEAPLQRESSSIHNQFYKPAWVPVSKTHREWFKPWKMGNVVHGDEPSHPGHIQGRRIAPRGHLNHTEHVNQDQTNTQAPVWSQVLSPGLDKSGQGITQSTQHVAREVAPGWPTTHAHQEPSQAKQGIAITGTKRAAKFDEATASRMSCLPPLKLLSRRVKSKCPPNTPGILQVKFQTDLTGRHFFQDWRAQPQGRYGSHEKPLVPSEDQVNPRLTYMPLFTQRVKLTSPRPMASSMRQILPPLSRENPSGQLQNLASKTEPVENQTA